MPDPEIYAFEADGCFPNSRLPAVVYRDVLTTGAEDMTRTFAANGWSNAWVDGIFPYHHFHSLAHEVLGIARGRVRVLLGGPSGRRSRSEPATLWSFRRGWRIATSANRAGSKWSAPTPEGPITTPGVARRTNSRPLHERRRLYRPTLQALNERGAMGFRSRIERLHAAKLVDPI